MKNEETLFLDGINPEESVEKKKGITPWKLVTLGGVSGVLMGAGSLYTGQIVAKELESGSKENSSFSDTTENGLKVADVDQGMSFGQAFAAARAEVGPGGVFHWHGGIYNTYTEAEWNAMTVEQKNDFAQQVKPEISANEVPTPTDGNTHIIVEHHVYHHVDHSANEVHANEDVQVASQQSSESDSDVHIVGYGEVQGHAAVGLDMNGDGQADVAIIDVDDSGDVSNPDVVVDRQGNMATIGELANANNPSMTTSNENPDITDEPQVEADYPLYDI